MAGAAGAAGNLAAPDPAAMAAPVVAPGIMPVEGTDGLWLYDGTGLVIAQSGDGLGTLPGAGGAAADGALCAVLGCNAPLTVGSRAPICDTHMKGGKNVAVEQEPGGGVHLMRWCQYCNRLHPPEDFHEQPLTVCRKGISRRRELRILNKSATSKKGRTCQVQKCGAPLTRGDRGCVCITHRRASSVKVVGWGDTLGRFCQYCHRFHELSCFSNKCRSVCILSRSRRASKQKPTSPSGQTNYSGSSSNNAPGSLECSSSNTLGGSTVESAFLPAPAEASLDLLTGAAGAGEEAEPWWAGLEQATVAGGVDMKLHDAHLADLQGDALPDIIAAALGMAPEALPSATAAHVSLGCVRIEALVRRPRRAEEDGEDSGHMPGAAAVAERLAASGCAGGVLQQGAWTVHSLSTAEGGAGSVSSAGPGAGPSPPSPPPPAWPGLHLPLAVVAGSPLEVALPGAPAGTEVHWLCRSSRGRAATVGAGGAAVVGPEATALEGCGLLYVRAGSRSAAPQTVVVLDDPALAAELQSMQARLLARNASGAAYVRTRLAPDLAWLLEADQEGWLADPANHHAARVAVRNAALCARMEGCPLLQARLRELVVAAWEELGVNLRPAPAQESEGSCYSSRSALMTKAGTCEWHPLWGFRDPVLQARFERWRDNLREASRWPVTYMWTFINVFDYIMRAVRPSERAQLNSLHPGVSALADLGTLVRMVFMCSWMMFYWWKPQTALRRVDIMCGFGYTLWPVWHIWACHRRTCAAIVYVMGYNYVMHVPLRSMCIMMSIMCVQWYLHYTRPLLPFPVAETLGSSALTVAIFTGFTSGYSLAISYYWDLKNRNKFLAAEHLSIAKKV